MLALSTVIFTCCSGGKLDSTTSTEATLVFANILAGSFTQETKSPILGTPFLPLNRKSDGPISIIDPFIVTLPLKWLDMYLLDWLVIDGLLKSIKVPSGTVTNLDSVKSVVPLIDITVTNSVMF